MWEVSVNNDATGKWTAEPTNRTTGENKGVWGVPFWIAWRHGRLGSGLWCYTDNPRQIKSNIELCQVWCNRKNKESPTPERVVQSDIDQWLKEARAGINTHDPG